MTKKEKREWVIVGLIVPWLIVILTSLIAFYSCKSRRLLADDLETSRYEQEQTNQAPSNARKKIKNYAGGKPSKKITRTPKIQNNNNSRSNSWRSSQGGIVVRYSLIDNGGNLNLKRNFHDGGSLNCYVTKQIVSGKTYLRPVTPIASGDYWVINGSELMCMDSLGVVCIAQPQ